MGFCAFWYQVSDYAGLAPVKPHRIRLFSCLFVHADRRFPRPLAGAVGTFLENAKLIFPLRAVEMASAAIFITSGTAGLKTVKSCFCCRSISNARFSPPVKYIPAAPPFSAGIKNATDFPICGVAICRKGRYLAITPLLLGDSLVTCLPAVLKTR